LQPASSVMRTTGSLISVSQGRIDGSLKPDLVATWLLALAEGAVGRVVFEPGFKPRAHRAMLRTIIRRMLKPQ
ncbi:hypothetical protein NBG98_32375, partial [Burkholderia cenocepacia]